MGLASWLVHSWRGFAGQLKGNQVRDEVQNIRQAEVTRVESAVHIDTRVGLRVR
jgi:hypothetical protein